MNQRVSVEPIGPWRLRNLRLTGQPLGSAAEVVGWLGAVQAQDFGPARWSIGQRGRGVRDTEVQAAFNAGDILRTHLLRPTWHFVTPADIRWLLALTRPRVEAMSAYGRRRDELDVELLARADGALGRALAGGQCLTRPEVATRLASEGISAQGTRLAHILMHAELIGLICSGPLRGKQHTYALLEERVPPAGELSHDQALAELTRRYFTSHGPASLKDFQWWSSLRQADIRHGLEAAAADLEHESIDGVTYWWGRQRVPERAEASAVHLLQMFDEYLVGYSETRRNLDLASLSRSLFQTINVRSGVVIVGSQVAGTWRRTPGRDQVLIEVKMTAGERPTGLEEETERYAAFLGTRASVRLAS